MDATQNRRLIECGFVVSVQVCQSRFHYESYYYAFNTIIDIQAHRCVSQLLLVRLLGSKVQSPRGQQPLAIDLLAGQATKGSLISFMSNHNQDPKTHPGVPYVKGARNTNIKKRKKVKTPKMTGPLTPISDHCLGLRTLSFPPSGEIG